jgi:uncharacterized protein YkwD
VRRWLALVLAGGCSGGDDGASHTDDDGTDLPEWPAAWTTLEEEVVALCNGYRQVGASCRGVSMPGGLDHLEMDPVLRGTARAHSLDMATRHFFAHENPDGDGPFDRMDAAGFAGQQPWGENIAAGVSKAAAVVELWMDSTEGHCENIMEPSFRVIGVGYDFDQDSEFGHYWTQNFAGSH